MSVSLLDRSSWAYGTTSITPTYPAMQVGNLLFLFVYWKATVTSGSSGPTTPSGWTQLTKVMPDALVNTTGGYGANGTDSGDMGLAIYYINVTTVLSGTLAVTCSNVNSGGAIFVAMQKTLNTWSTPDVRSVWQTTTPTSPIVKALTQGGNIGLLSGDSLISGMAIPTDVTTPGQFSAQTFTHTGSTFSAINELSEADSTLGQDMGGYIGVTDVTGGTDAAASLSISLTLAGTITNVRGPIFAVRLRDFNSTPPVNPVDYWGAAA